MLFSRSEKKITPISPKILCFLVKAEECKLE